MIQPRICSWTKPSCKHTSSQPTTFLHLPEHVRHRIYYYYDGISSNTSFYFREKEAAFFVSALDHLPTTAITSYLRLRLVSRTVRDDIPRCLCSYYRIRLYSTELTETSLPILLEAPWNLLSYSRRLTVELNHCEKYCSAKCPCLYCRSDKIRIRNGAGLPRLPWDLEEAERFQLTLSRLVHHLSTLPDVSKLELGFRCDVKDPKTAALLMGPLKELRVSKCSIRLGEKFTSQLESIARETVLGVTRNTPPVRDSFRFMDLPPELRQRILGFTDLVTPNHEIQWRYRFSTQAMNKLRSPFCFFGEFCRQHFAAYPTCVCWRRPVSLFLVCRKMLQDVLQVFYTSNRFAVLRETWPHQVPHRPRSNKFEAATFLTEVVSRHGLAHLRDLELVFPLWDYNYLGFEPWVLSDWERAVQYAAEHLKKLSLTLYFVQSTVHYDIEPIHTDDIEQSQAALLQVQEQIIRPFQQLRPVLTSFFVHVDTPFASTYGTTNADYTRIQPSLRANEKYLEELVMGKGYDSVAEGKAERSWGGWWKVYDLSGDADGAIDDSWTENYQQHLLMMEELRRGKRMNWFEEQHAKGYVMSL